MAEHRDEAGQTCTRHAPASREALLALATIGSRMPGFHHDCASKLQSLMMSIEEMLELSPSNELRQALEGASQSLRELHELFQVNRALARSPQPKRGLLADLVRGGASRAGVKLRGETGGIEVVAAPPAMIHALSLLLDIVAGPSNLGRTVELTTAVDDQVVTLVVTGPQGAAAKPPPNTSELLAIVDHVVVREGGQLRCVNGGESFQVLLLRAR